MEKISRTQKKRQAEALQKLGEQLIGLSEDQTATLNLPPELLEAVSMARRMTKHEARRRQLQYIGRLMREIDPETVNNALQKLGSQEELDRRKFKRVEQWRDELVAGSDERSQWLISQYPELDNRQLAHLVHNARNAQNTPKARTSNRQLFRFLAKSITI